MLGLRGSGSSSLNNDVNNRDRHESPLADKLHLHQPSNRQRRNPSTEHVPPQSGQRPRKPQWHLVLQRQAEPPLHLWAQISVALTTPFNSTNQQQTGALADEIQAKQSQGLQSLDLHMPSFSHLACDKSGHFPYPICAAMPEAEDILTGAHRRSWRCRKPYHG